MDIFRLPKSLWCVFVCLLRERKSRDERRDELFPLGSFLAGFDLGLTEGDLRPFSRGLEVVGEWRDDMEGEGVVDIALPFRKGEDVS